MLTDACKGGDSILHTTLSIFIVCNIPNDAYLHDGWATQAQMKRERESSNMDIGLLQDVPMLIEWL